MSDVVQFPVCVDAQTLAAFVDGRLEAAARQRVEGHLADCDDCYEVFTEIVHVCDKADQETARTAKSSGLRRWQQPAWWAAGGLVAASIALAIIARPEWITRGSPSDRAMREFVSAVGQNRFAAARLSDEFAWAPPPSPTRGTESASLSLDAEEAALKLRALAERQPNAATLRGAGVALLAAGNVDGAVRSFEESIRLQPETGAARIDLSAALLERWRRTQSAGDAARALDEAERARQAGPRLHAALFNRALAFEALGMSAEARTAWEAYLAADSASAWAKEARERLAALKTASSVVPQITPATPLTEIERLARTDPLPLYRRLERDALRSWADGVLAGKPADLTEAHSIARALDTAQRDRYFVDLTALAARMNPEQTARVRCLARAIDLLGRWWSLYDSGAYSSARQGALDAREQLACAGASTVEADVRLSIVDVASGRSADALRRLETIEGLSIERGYTRALAVVHQLRGLASLQQSNIDAAVDAYGKAAGFAERAGDTELASLSKAYLVTARFAQGDHSSAWRDLVTCARQLDSVESGRRRFQFFSRAAALAQDSGLYGTALALGDALLRDPVERQFAWAQVAGHLFRARAKASLGWPEQAAGDVEVAKKIADRIEDPLFRNETLAEVALTTGQILATSDSRTAVGALTEALAFQHVRSNQFRMASLLLHRGRAYAHAGDPRRAEADWMEGAALLEDARVSIREAQLRVARTAATWDLFEELVNSQRDRPGLALQTVERSHARELLDSVAPDTAVEAFRNGTDFKWLPANSAALVYASLPGRLLIWHLTAGGMSLEDRPVSASALRDLVSKSLRAIQSGGEPDRGLAEVLLPRVPGLTATANLIVVPDGPLHQLPFGLLRGPSNGSRLMDTTVLTVAPSLAILKVLVQRPSWSKPASPLLVGAGGADVREGLPPLPGVREEIQGLHELYPTARVLVGSDARPEAVLRYLPEADLLHFAGHAVSDPIHPSRSRLLLSIGKSSATLRPADIAAGRMRPGGVVVLGACDTASGNTFRGEGPLNLARPFLVAGASSVIATLWPIGDRDAARILLEVHSLIAQGQSPGVALATVQRREQGVARINSAAFVLIGRA